MEILSINADQKLANIAASIGQNPQSWRNWFCLVITIKDENENLRQEGVFWTQSILDVYLQDIEGRVYASDNGSIHILCKSYSPDVLEQAGVQICALVQSESHTEAEYEIYDLTTDGFLYTQHVLHNIPHMFSVPTSKANLDAALQNTKPAEPEETGFYGTAELPKVLLVEDDPVTRWMVRNALKNECHLSTADTGNKAFAVYNSFQPDLVFLDIGLPDKSGYEVLEWITRNDPGARVVMFSGQDDLDNITNALDEGACGFIAKPFLKENLLHYIQGHAGAAA